MRERFVMIPGLSLFIAALLCRLFIYGELEGQPPQPEFGPRLAPTALIGSETPTTTPTRIPASSPFELLIPTAGEEQPTPQMSDLPRP